MDASDQLTWFLDLLERLEIDVRREHLGGTGCHLCAIKGKKVMFIDLDADLATQLDDCAEAIAQIRRVDEVYVPPGIRARLERKRASLG